MKPTLARCDASLETACCSCGGNGSNGGNSGGGGFRNFLSDPVGGTTAAAGLRDNGDGSYTLFYDLFVAQSAAQCNCN